MSTAQNAVNAEPGNGSATIRARVGDSAIDKVTRLFSAGLADIFTETLQNSRRGGANSPVMKSLSDQSVSGATMMTSIAGLPSMFATMAIARAASN